MSHHNIEQKKNNLALWIFIGLIGGIFVGTTLNYAVDSVFITDYSSIAKYGNIIFLKFIKLIIGPLVLSTLVVGVASIGDAGTIGALSFDGRLPQELIREFVANNQRPSRLDTRFGFGVRYRLVAGEGESDAETSLPMIPVAWLVEQEGGAPEIIDRLAFSRVGLNLRADQALLYVANQRPDGTGAGFLLWFVRRQKLWSLYDTEVLWVARPEQGGPGGR